MALHVLGKLSAAELPPAPLRQSLLPGTCGCLKRRSAALWPAWLLDFTSSCYQHRRVIPDYGLQMGGWAASEWESRPGLDSWTHLLDFRWC